jgi:phosphoenolpyruvate carboxykinase (ATP)
MAERYRYDEALMEFGVAVPGHAIRNISVAQLIEYAVTHQEGHLVSNGALNAITAPRTGRSPKDKFIVKSGEAEKLIHWGANAALDPRHFDALFSRVAEYVRQRTMFVFDGFSGADPTHRLAVRIKTELAWHSLFVHQLFLRPTPDELKGHRPEFTLICVPGFHARPTRDHTASEAFIVINYERRVVLIGGTRYAGEMKKSIFTVMNYLMPRQGVLPMHCSANIGADGDVALFFGLSGTGKTTLSADPERRLIGDDEHGWSDNGIFNFEGGCYAKCIGLTREREPQIFDAIRFGSVLENVVIDDDRNPDFSDNFITENTRCAYPVEYIENAVIPGVGGHPRNVVFLTADATGVLPPVAKLTEAQAMYHFLSGYTSKLAGTETGVKEPQAVFSTCFGAPFLPLPPNTYAGMLGERLRKHGAACYLINTGWNGGPHGVGSRISLPFTRAIIHAVLRGDLEKTELTPDPTFGILVPNAVAGVPPEILQPRNTWPDKGAYDKAAKALATSFRENFERFADIPDEVKSAGPKA